MANFRSLLVLVASILFCCQVSAQVVSSDFVSNADGWTAPNALAGSFTYSGTGGNPNGFISAQTPGSVILGSTTLWIPYYFNAPSKFTGVKTAYYGGGLSFDLSQTTTGTASAVRGTVVLTNVAGLSIYYWPNTLFAPPSFGSWGKFEVPLSATT